jgi:hypothetical protein
MFTQPTRDPHREINTAPDFQGTLVAIDISLDNNEAFDALLEMISLVYDNAIRERKRAKYREPRFI